MGLGFLLLWPCCALFFALKHRRFEPSSEECQIGCKTRLTTIAGLYSGCIEDLR